MTITTTGDDDETMCYSHTYENKNELRHDDGDDNKDDKDATMHCIQTNRGITYDGQWLSVMLLVTVITSMFMTKEDEEQDLFDDGDDNDYEVGSVVKRSELVYTRE